MPLIDVGGVPLHFVLSGRPGAPVLLFSNSLGTTLDMWEPQLEAFERDFQVLRYDMRGHGVSSTPPGTYTLAQLGGDVVALLDRLEIESVVFCGLSLGGVIGQWLGIHAAARVRKLVLCNTAAKIGTPDTWNARIATVQTEGMPAIADAVIARWFTTPFLATKPAVVDTMRQMLSSADPAGYAAACAAIRDMDQRDDVGSIACPTLIVGGEYDTVTTIEDAHFLESRIAEAAFASLPTAHISNAEAPLQFNAAVLRFLS